MSKFELKKKDVLSNFTNVIKIGYCDLEMLNWNIIEKLGYTAGVYGWNADVYVVNPSTVIVTGYRPFGNIVPSRELIEKYNTLYKLLYDYSYDYDIFHEKLYDMLDDFSVEAIEEAKND